MASAEETLGGIVNRRALPSILLGLAVLMVLISFAVGWFSIDTILRRWEYDPAAEDGKGPSKGLARLDLEMHMLRLESNVSPANLEQMIRERGEPNYDEHAGRMGTIMLGVLMLQFVVFLNLLAICGFYYLLRRRGQDTAVVTKRLFIVFVAISVVTLLYFALTIGPAGRGDVEFIHKSYALSEEVAYDIPRPDIGFWDTWETEPKQLTPVGQEDREVWQFTVLSRPSAGWWLGLMSFVCTTGAWILATRNGDFRPVEERLEPPGPLPKVTSG